MEPFSNIRATKFDYNSLDPTEGVGVACAVWVFGRELGESVDAAERESGEGVRAGEEVDEDATMRSRSSSGSDWAG